MTPLETKKPRARLARRVYFSSAHRYFSPKLTEEQNREVFGSCYSEHGHGHNYILEAYISGPIDSTTGMVINLMDVDEALKQVSRPLDHKHLNFDIPYFKELVPTTENIARYLYDEIEKALQGQDVRLEKVRLYEGEDLWVDYGQILFG